MLASVLTEHGPPDVLHVETVPDPAPRPGEVVVELHAAALNRRDTYVRAGASPAHRFPLPLILGSDGAGIRRDTGEEVVILPSLDWGEREDAPGDGFRILGGPDDGTYAELIAIPVASCFPKPRHLSWQEAASFPLAALTAYRALFARGGLHPGETVLVLGIGSGTSTFAMLLAHRAGARVIVTSSSDEKLARAVELCSVEGVNYTHGDWAEEVRERTGGSGADLVVDAIGATWPESLRCLRKGGRLVAFGATGGGEATLSVRAVFSGQFSILGTSMGSPRDFAALLRMVERPGFHPVVDSARPLAEAAAAHERMETGSQFGKLVLEIR
jgi:NADPH:quinone reductase-like Zn-dependent oxidoreductase